MNIVELSYPIIGQTLPSDNGYPLYSAISRHLGEHLPEDVSLASVGGLVSGRGQVLVSSRSHLRLRTPCEKINLLLGLAGAASMSVATRCSLAYRAYYPSSVARR